MAYDVVFCVRPSSDPSSEAYGTHQHPELEPCPTTPGRHVAGGACRRAFRADDGFTPLRSSAPL